MPDTIYDHQHRPWDLIPGDDRYRRRDHGWIALTPAEIEARHGITGRVWLGHRKDAA